MSGAPRRMSHRLFRRAAQARPVVVHSASAVVQRRSRFVGAKIVVTPTIVIVSSVPISPNPRATAPSCPHCPRCQAGSLCRSTAGTTGGA